MASKKNDLWLVPEADSNPGFVPVAPTGSGMTRAEKAVEEKFRANSAEETFKGIETIQAGLIVNAITRNTMENGVDLIEFAYDLRREGARDAEEQKTVDSFLGTVLQKGLKDAVTTADIGIRDVQNTLRRPLTPDPKKWWER
jgi:hypothetical protein